MKESKNALNLAEKLKIEAQDRENEIKKSTTNYYLRDAQVFLDQKKYEVAMKKYIYLRDSIMFGETTEAIENKIAICQNLIEKNKVYKNLATHVKLDCLSLQSCKAL